VGDGESGEGEGDTLDEESEGFNGVSPGGGGRGGFAEFGGSAMLRSGSNSSAQVLPLESPRTPAAPAAGRAGAGATAAPRGAAEGRRGRDEPWVHRTSLGEGALLWAHWTQWEQREQWEQGSRGVSWRCRRSWRR